MGLAEGQQEQSRSETQILNPNGPSDVSGRKTRVLLLTTASLLGSLLRSNRIHQAETEATTYGVKSSSQRLTAVKVACVAIGYMLG